MTDSSAALAILWEIWTAHRRGFAAVLAALPVCAVAARLLASPGQNELWFSAAVVALGSCLVALFVFFTFTEQSREQKLTVFPVRLFTLPVRTWVLVMVPMLSGAISVGVFYAAWAGLVLPPLGVAPAVIRPAFLLVTGMLSYLAVMWGLARFRLGRLFFCAVIGVLLVWGLVFPEALLPDALAWVSEGARSAALGGGLAVLNLAAFLWAWVAVDRQRHVRTQAEGILAVEPRPAVRKPRRPLLPFASRAQAQFWLEWRRNGRPLPASILIFVLLAAVALPVVIELNGANTLKVAGCMLLFPLAMATLFGKSFAVLDFWSQELTLPPFVAVRPQSCAEIILTKFKVAACSVALGWLLLMGGLGLVVAVWGDASLLRQGWHKFLGTHSPGIQTLIVLLGIWALVLLTLRQLVVSLYLGLSGWAGVFSAAVVASFGIYFVAVPWVTTWALDEGILLWGTRLPWQGFIWAASAIFIVKLSLACWTWSLSHRRGLINARAILGYWLFWTLGTASLVLLVVLAMPGYPWVRKCTALACVLALPLARPGLAPLTLAINRHRVTSARPSGKWWRPLPLWSIADSVCKVPSRAVRVLLPAQAVAFGALVLIAARVTMEQVPHRVDGGDCRLRLLQLGQGTPTIVLESDLLGFLEHWWPVQQELARSNRVVAYERAGHGGSSPRTQPLSATRVAEELHTALTNAKAPPPYLLVGSGVGALHMRIFAHLYPQEVAGLLLLDPRQNETSTEALTWLRSNRAELLPDIEQWLRKFPGQVHGYGLCEFKNAELRLENLPPEARAAARPVRWDEVTDGVLYAVGIQVGHMQPGPLDEFALLDNLILRDRAALPLPRVPLTMITGVKRGQIGTVEWPTLDDFLTEQKLARQRGWLRGLSDAKHIITQDSAGPIPADQPELVVQSVRQMLNKPEIRNPKEAQNPKSESKPGAA